jgi:predicted Zn-dependent protease
MKRWLIFTGLILLITASLVWTEKERVAGSVGPGAVLYFVADTERELTRLPVAFTAMSDDQEIEIGDDLAQRYINQTDQSGERRPLSATVAQDYVREVGERLSTHARRKLPYRFHYIDSPGFVNAFALPGGHVFIGNGLISLMDSEDELAAVLGHEVEHIDLHHAAERVQTEQALRKVPLGGLVAIPVEVFQAGYSKDEELEADREGTRLAVAAGYSPLGALRMFETYDRLYREYVTKAQSPQEELAGVAVQTLEDYFRSHPRAPERIAQVRRMINAENWGGLTSERPLRIAYVFWSERARRAQQEHQYDYAVRAATHSLSLQPEQPDVLDVLGRAQFMLADFEAAAATDRTLLERKPADVDLASRYASALGARGAPAKAAPEFQEWLAAAKIQDTDVITQIKVDAAGLWLLAGNSKPAAEIEQVLKRRQDSVWAPERLGRLGSWYYRAGHYDQAASLLKSALEQRPQENALMIQLGWTLVAQHNYASALARFTELEHPAAFPLGAEMGTAVAKWESRQNDDALAHFAVAIRQEPAWLNDRWVKALYAPDVAMSIAEMRAERERRQKKDRGGRFDLDESDRSTAGRAEVIGSRLIS